MGPPTGGASSRRSPAGCRRGGVTASSAEPVGSSRPSRSSGSGTRRSTDLRRRKVVDEATCDWLAGYRFSGDVSGYAEGEVYFPGSPVLVVESSFAEGVVLETLALSILNHDTAIASAASRHDRRCRRPALHRDGLPANARGGRGRGRPRRVHRGLRDDEQPRGRPSLRGTRRPAPRRTRSPCVHDSEREAFEAQVASLGPGTTLLVDTYDVPEGVRTAVEVAGTTLGAVRLDSGDLLEQARQVRAQLDSLGATATRIVVTSDLDEYAIASLASAPGRRLRGGDAAGDRFGCTHREHGLQARLAIRRRRGDAAGREAERVEDLGRWPQVGAAPALPRRGGGGRGRRYRRAPHGRRGRPRADGRPGPRGRAVGPAGPRPPPGRDTWPRAPSCRPAPCGCSAARSPSRRCSRTGTAAET